MAGFSTPSAGAVPHASTHEAGGADEVSLDTSQITTGRFTTARLPGGTTNYVLTAKGANVNPEYAETRVPSGNAILENIQKHLGVFWFNNNWLPAGMIDYDVSGTGSTTWSSSHVGITTGTTSGSTAHIRKKAWGLQSASWNKKRYLSCRVWVDSISNQKIWLVSGSFEYSLERIGFRISNDHLVGVVSNYEENSLWLKDLTESGHIVLECILDPGIPECRFYVDGVDKGAITKEFPTGEYRADYLLDASIENTAAEDKKFNIYEYRLLQFE